MKTRLLLLLSLFFVCSVIAVAQIPVPNMHPDSIRSYTDKMPSFSIYKDNYFITGINPTRAINKNNADARFQISFKQRVTKSTLPLESHLFITYTQASTWDIYDQSAPFRNTDYNPGFGLGHVIIHNGKVRGFSALTIEHQSNGRDSIWNRSVNWVGLYAQFMINPRLGFEAKTIIPFGISKDNRDLFKYKGFLNLGVNYIFQNRKFQSSIQFQKTTKSFVSGNLIIEGSYLLNDLYNIHLFGQYYNGYGENLLEYNRHTNYIRIGIVFKPEFLTVH